jgi:hypothetical protein
MTHADSIDALEVPISCELLLSFFLVTDLEAVVAAAAAAIVSLWTLIDSGRKG